MRAAALLLALIGLASPARGEVVDKAANGFTIKVVLEVAAPPETVYTALVRSMPDAALSGRCCTTPYHPSPSYVS